LVYRAQETLDQQVKKFFTNVPVRAVIQIWKNERNEVVFLFQTVPHYLHYAEEAPNGFLSNNVFAIS